MSDIHYKWNAGLNSVQISSDVSLPQFKVLGHRQRTIEASLSTGTLLIECKCKYHNYNVQEIVKMISHELLISHPGNYSRLACEIQFVRSKGYYLIQVRVLGVYAKVPSLPKFHFGKDHNHLGGISNLEKSSRNIIILITVGKNESVLRRPRFYESTTAVLPDASCLEFTQN